MAAGTEPRQGHGEPLPSRRQELFMFALLAILIWPVIAVAVVGGYGFLVWMWQLVFGPPGPPG
jgi:periplasmic nitrate reductase NapE